MPTEQTWDYIVVGAGSAGCVMADRLSRNPKHRVLLLEAGGRDTSPLIHMPKGIGKLVLDPRHAWVYPVSQPRMPGQPATETWVRGRGLGGSSSINGMIWMHGQPEDYDAWERAGATGWNWQVMRAAFKAVEDHELGTGPARGVGGPVYISTGKFRYPLAEAAIRAGEQMGLQRKADLNDEEQEGIGYFPHNIRKGRRQSAAVAFLRPAMHRPNLTVLTEVEVDRIVFSGKRAAAVKARTARGEGTYLVDGEVILCAGAIVSPAILQRSGIGPANVLFQAGVPVLVSSPAVGKNLRDHLGLSVAFRLKGNDRGNNFQFRKIGLVCNLVRYAVARNGPMATGPYEIGAFVRSMPDAVRPDLQLYVGAFSFARNLDPNFPVQLSAVEKEPGLTIYGQMLQPESTGSVAITGPDPAAPLAITPNWLTTSRDQAGAVAMVRTIRQLASQPALAGSLGEELVPGKDVNSDADILQAVRQLSRAGTHATGSCAMGGLEAALDPDCRVRGVDGIRVIDCGSMPGLVSGNTNGPAIAFAWAMADRMGLA
ncbi:glucose-methanol-choline oxidoreductase [Novosphingobium sp. ERN07]|uniref:GMC family oxidoreductase n=1 Tax=Novosphingobium sp. ERN07 TaxID=2726187 RepID=UPI00145709D5|nr:GMC family oxidoreductase N-terminal domain-containing protein [Novosphingobium sp. ERN07]NLR73211.1 glucose-methanol-choline oxidoreductase [Novosphingobium sp. ERN07]